jgi:hypothetical protein
MQEADYGKGVIHGCSNEHTGSATKRYRELHGDEIVMPDADYNLSSPINGSTRDRPPLSSR